MKECPQIPHFCIGILREFDSSVNSGEGKLSKIQKAFARQGLGLKT